jgi:energy-coupling factor transporter ATP-binding protein EcfA2
MVGLLNDTDREILSALRFTAIELGDSIALGGDVRVDIAPRATVLVGKNGVGKSAILECIHEALGNAVGVPEDSSPDPGRLRCDIAHDNRMIVYQCEWSPRDDAEDSPRGSHPGPARLVETCFHTAAQQLLWRVDDGHVSRNDGTEDEITPGRGLLNWTWARRKGFVFNIMVYPLRGLLGGLAQIAAGVPRDTRQELFLPYSYPLRTRAAQLPGTARMRSLLFCLAQWQHKEPALMEELVAVGRRTGLFDEVRVLHYRDSEAERTPARQRKDLIAVEIDGVNVGLLSDGVLRSTELLIALIDPDIKLVLIEEPETAVHPGLLARLLNEIDAYAGDRQIIMTTHSPQVASWARPDELRLVERHDGAVHVRGLDADEIARLERYLHDEGTLGDFVYSGALDG